MNLSIRMRIIYNVKNRYATRMIFGDKILTSPTKLMLQTKVSIYSIIKENLHLYCRKQGQMQGAATAANVAPP